MIRHRGGHRDLICDACPIDRAIHGVRVGPSVRLNHLHLSAAVLRDMCRAEGWRREGTLDVCPACAADPESIVSPPADVGAVLECRTKRADGSREVVEVLEIVDAETIRVRVTNPNPRRPTPPTRTIKALPSFGRRPSGWGKYRVIQLADGTPVIYPGGRHGV